jgi:hypothetical protein
VILNWELATVWVEAAAGTAAAVVAVVAVVAHGFLVPP